MRDGDDGRRLGTLRSKLPDAQGRLGRLYELIEKGLANLSGPAPKGRIAAVKTERDIAQVALDRAAAELNPAARITEGRIAAFAEVMPTNMPEGEMPFRRAHIRSVIDQVEVDVSDLRIRGRRTVLERLVTGGGAAPAAVPGFVRKWRARKDSNL